MNVEMPHKSKLAHSCPLSVVRLWVKCIILSVIPWYCLSFLNHCFHSSLCVRFVFNFNVMTHYLYLPRYAIIDEYGAGLLISAVLLVFVHVPCYILPVLRVLIMALPAGQ